MKKENKMLVEFLNKANVRTRSDNQRYILVNDDLITGLEYFKNEVIKQFLKAIFKRKRLLY